MKHIKAQSWKVGLVVVLIMVMAGSAACSKPPAAYTQARATVDAYVTAYEAKDAGGTSASSIKMPYTWTMVLALSLIHI